MKRTFTTLICISAFIFFACRGTSTKTSQLANNNNLILTSAENINHADNTPTRIIIEGQNNILEIIEKNTVIRGLSNDVIIIKGNGNIIRLISTDLIDNRLDSSDTLVFLGDNKKYVLDSRNKFPLPARNYNIKNVVLTETPAEPTFDPRHFIQDDEQRISLAYFDTLVTVRFAVDYFTARLPSGEASAYFELGEMFLYGIGVEASPARALELLEFAAARDHISALIRLGDIYINGAFGCPKDRDRALFYYKKCSTSGNDYCTEKLQQMK